MVRKITRLPFALALCVLVTAAGPTWGLPPGATPRLAPPGVPAALQFEGEALLTSARANEGKVSVQSMAPFGRAWSGGSQLYWVPSRLGAKMDVTIRIPRAGMYSLAVSFTSAPDYGTVQVSVNGARVGPLFSGYASRVSHSGRIPLGSARLQAGRNVLTFTVVGRDKHATGLMVGIDRIELVPLSAATPSSPATTAGPSPAGKLAVLSPTAAVSPVPLPVRPINRPIMRAMFQAVRPYPVTIRPPKPKVYQPPNADLRPTIAKLQLAVRDQGARGTCSVHAMTFLLEYMYATRKHLNFGDLSEEYLNYAANQVTGKYADGDFFSNLDLGYRKWGDYPEGLVPYQAKFNPKYKVPSAYLNIGKKWVRFNADFIKPWNAKTGASMGQLYQVMIYLEKNTPVAAGLWWYKKGLYKSTVIHGVDVVVTPQKRNVDCQDGHSIALVGYRKDPAFPGGGYFIYRNSWGAGWGDKGYGYMPFEYLLKYANDLVAYRE